MRGGGLVESALRLDEDTFPGGLAGGGDLSRGEVGQCGVASLASALSRLPAFPVLLVESVDELGKSEVTFAADSAR